MKKSSGSNLVEYSIGAALIGIIIGFSINAIQENQIIPTLFSKALGMKIDDNKAILTTSNYVEETNTLMDTSQPVTMICDNGDCNINFGDYSLTGIPENIADIVETSGISGATEKTLSILDQLSEQMVAEGLVEESQQLKDLANLGYYIADQNRKIEDASSECTVSNDPYQCIKDYLKDKKVDTLPSNIENLMPNYYKPENKYEEFFYSTSMIDAFITPDPNDKYADTDDPGKTFVELYQNIKSDEEISGEVQTLVQNIYKTVYDLNYESWSKVNNLNVGATYEDMFAGNPYYDPITGELDPSKTYDTSVNIESIGDPTTSVGTTFGSTIACELGLNTTENLACQ